MPAPSPELVRQREKYRAALAAIDAALAQELAAMSIAEGLKRAQSLRLFTADNLPSRPSSGLLEQQALFQKIAGQR